MELQPLSDQAVMISCRDEAEAAAVAEALRREPFPWQVDVVQAYLRIALFYDSRLIAFGQAAAALRARPWRSDRSRGAARLHVVPCCYDFGLDLERIASHTGLSAEEAIRLHSTSTFVVYAIGFCPGFPYLGYLPPKLANVPRLPSPRLRVDPGSVGLTGKQTGVYTEARPGGWNIIGRTPCLLCDLQEGWFPLRTGDQVRFERIDAKEFAALAGKRLPQPSAETNPEGVSPTK